MVGDEEQKSGRPPPPKGSNSSKNSAPWENANHPLYIHHFDQPGTSLVAHMLMEDNYINWVQAITMALTIKNKKGFIDGTLTRPTPNLDEHTQ